MSLSWNNLQASTPSTIDQGDLDLLASCNITKRSMIASLQSPLSGPLVFCPERSKPSWTIWESSSKVLEGTFLGLSMCGINYNLGNSEFKYRKVAELSL